MMFRYVYPLVLLLFQGYLYVRLARWIDRGNSVRPALRRIVQVLFVVFNVALITVALTRPRWSSIPDWVMYVGFFPFVLWHTSTFLVALFLFLASVAILPFRALRFFATRIPHLDSAIRRLRNAPHARRFDAGRRKVLRAGVYGIGAMSFGGTAYGMLSAGADCEVTDTTLYLPNLPEAMAGFRIGFITDIHSSMYMRKQNMDRFVAIMNNLRPDMIAIGGDIVNGLEEEVYPFAESFRELYAPHGVFAVLGNHDYYSGAPDTIAQVLRSQGITVLRNERRFIGGESVGLWIMGVDDARTAAIAAKRYETAIGDASGEFPRIMLCHRPYFLSTAASYDIDLMLSGHTHGGQLVFGKWGDRLLTPAAFASPYVYGHYRVDGTQMFLSRGVGTVAIPVRINCPPEIVNITLQRTDTKPLASVS